MSPADATRVRPAASLERTADGSTSRGERALAAGGWLALWLGFAWCIGLGVWGQWYSPSLAHRLQTEALWRGTLALQETPHGQMADWAWGNGSQHVWGLGPALWRFPFEAVAKLAGADGFPDRVALLLAFVVAGLACARPFHDASPWERFVLALVMVAPPAFLTLCRTRLAVYEESVAYAHLVAVTLASLVLVFAARGRARDLFGTCALAGVAPLFRPTLLFDAGVSVALAIGVCILRPARTFGQGGWSKGGAIAVGLVLFATGLAVVGVIGEARFGSPFETGQLLNVSYIPTDQAAKLFGYPFRDEPFSRAAAELVSSLVLPARWNAPHWYAAAIHPWQSPAVRFREFYFTTFTAWQMALLAAAWSGVALLAVGARRGARVAGWIAAPVGAAALWSFAVFACQTLFYLWSPSMTSRYAVDFAAPFGVGASALLLTLLRAADAAATPQWVGQLRLALVSGALLWVLHDDAVSEVAPSHQPGPLLTAEQAAVALHRPAPQANPLPAAYRCGDSPESTGIKFNGSGWSTPGGCEVHAATMLFLPMRKPACVRVHVAPPAGESELHRAQTAAVRARLGLSEMTRVSEATDPGRLEITFCPPASHRMNPHGIELLYLGWVRPAELSPDARPFRLLAVEEVTAP